MYKRFSIILLAVVFIFSVFLIVGGEEESPQKLIDQAGEHFEKARQDKSAQELKQAIELYEQSLEGELPLESKKQALNKLSESYYLLANIFLTEREEQEDAYNKGREAGIKSLMLYDEFRENFGDDPTERLNKEVLPYVEDVAALYWVVSSAIRIDEFAGVVAQQKYIPLYKEIYNRLIELDETYMGGGPHRSFGALHCKVRLHTTGGIAIAFILGLSEEEGKKHLQKAIDIDPEYLDNKFFYAKYWASARDKELFVKLLNEIIEASPEVVEKYPLRNWAAQKEAQTLLEEAQEE